MKTSTYLLCAGLMVVGLLVTVGPASAWPDVMAHHDFDSGSPTNALGLCKYHMANPTNLVADLTTGLTWFKLCKADSGATDFFTELRKNTFPYALATPSCSLAKTSIPEGSLGLKFSCPLPTQGTYRSTIKYWVGNSGYAGHADYIFVK